MTASNWAVEYFVLTLRALVSAAATMLMLKTIQANQVNATSLASVSWNATNPIFKASKNDHVIEVKLFDDIDFVCPYYETTGAENHSDPYEYLTIYMVNRREYDDCIIHPEGTATPILNCSNPHQRKRFTILFEPFQSIPNVHEYQPGSSYYYITTSTGKSDGLDNLVHGACLERNMKLTIRVCCLNIAAKGNSSQSRFISKSNDAFFTLKHTTRKDDEHSPPLDIGKRSRQTSTPTTRATAGPIWPDKEKDAGEADQRSSLQSVIQVINRRHESTDVSTNKIHPMEDRSAKHEKLLSPSDAISCFIFQLAYSVLCCFVTCLTTVLLTWHS